MHTMRQAQCLPCSHNHVCATVTPSGSAKDVTRALNDLHSDFTHAQTRSHTLSAMLHGSDMLDVHEVQRDGC
jgi:hypothetical protein